MRFLSVEPLLEDLGAVDLDGIHWVIVGGESGPGARPLRKSWVLNIRDRCASRDIPFFFKQWGGVRKSEAGREIDGTTYDGVPSRGPARILSREDRLTLLAATMERFSLPVV